MVIRQDIAQLVSKQSRSIRRQAKRDSWPCQTRATRGEQEQIYHIADLPEDIQVAYAASLGTTFEALQNELKPFPKASAKHLIGGYNGYGSAPKT
jgi:hypothetical protein